jgi:hypothetical protein
MPAVHRNGDSRACGATTVVSGQSTVYVNNELVAVENDPNSHGAGGLNASVNPGTVFIEGKEMVVNGSTAGADSLCVPLGGSHCAPSATSGSPDVFAF